MSSFALRNALSENLRWQRFTGDQGVTTDKLTSYLVMATGACAAKDLQSKIPSVGMPLAFKSAKEAIGRARRWWLLKTNQRCHRRLTVV